MNRNNGPLSPVSSGSNDSSYAKHQRYPNNMSNGGHHGGFMGAPSDVPYSGGPYNATRALQSPPSSSHPSSGTDASRPSASSAGRPPSSASSVGGRSMALQSSQRDSTRSNFRPEHEDVLQKHYYSLRTYLAAHLRDEKGNMKPNRARDKLLRLSVTQFMELSTDVYDELVRREDDRTSRVQNVPRFLPPKQNFHPKRNQARQKLSTLPVERFRQLATDVFFELERRVPRFVAGDIDRPMSSGMRGPPGWRGPGSSPKSRQTSDASSIGRPLPKNFNGGTVVPNKSTMVEDDDDEEEEGSTGRYSEMMRDKETIRSQETEIEELNKQIGALEDRLQEKDQELETVRNSGEEYERGIHTERSEWSGLREELEQKVSDAQRLNDDIHNELEMLKRNKYMDEQQLQNQLQDSNRNLDELRDQHDRAQHQVYELQNSARELDELRGQHDRTQQQVFELQDSARELDNLKVQHSAVQQELSQLQLNNQHGAGSQEQDQRIHMLEEELSKQEALMSEVRVEAMANLQEMRELSRQNDQAVEQEERLAAQVTSLQRDIDDWRDRYARVKVQNKSLRASTMGLNLQTGFDVGSLQRKEGLISHDGLVKDVDITRFQLAIDNLLKVARQTSTEAMVESVKQVTFSVQSITSDIGTDGYPTPSPSPHSPRTAPDISVGRLKARVTGTANSLITATKQHATSSGLSPVALLDAAASNLTASVVELIKAVGIKPSSGGANSDADIDSVYDARDSGDEDVSVQPVVAVAVQQVSAAGGLARSNTSKKAAGWFNWGRRSESDEEEELSNGHPQETDDYEAYT